jgi:hypothetical protein
MFQPKPNKGTEGMNNQTDTTQPETEPVKPPETVIFPDPIRGPIEIPVLPPDYVNEGLDPRKLGIVEKKS